MSLPRRLEIIRQNLNADLRSAQADGITAAELIGLAAALTEELLLALPDELREIGVECVVENLPERIRRRAKEKQS